MHVRSSSADMARWRGLGGPAFFCRNPFIFCECAHLIGGIHIACSDLDMHADARSVRSAGLLFLGSQLHTR